ncbi:MAG: hypothetical protein L0027_14320 [Candidatus Rokubacteria bacterium]|nr:hypothetical protein [Candidatus Rokubacteria bacterium]
MAPSRWTPGLLTVLIALVGVADAQAPPSPGRDQPTSEVRGLSAKEIDDLLEGRGMGLARAAELNGYPGPRHVLEAVHANQLQLSPAQLQSVQALYERMAGDARRLGEQILREERALEAAFRHRAITADDLKTRVARLGALQSELRLVHLHTHLETRARLSDPQVERYNQLRGYSGAAPPAHRH